MPPTAYQQALTASGPAASQTVESTFVTWVTDRNLRQVSQNVADETALDTNDFASLLSSFAAELPRCATPVAAWQTACRGHKLRGRQIPVADCPAVLGRAKGLDDHAKSVAKASLGALTPSEAEKLLRKYSGSLHPAGLETFLRESPLGNYIVWATFDAAHPNADPFDQFPSSHEAICTALGLGRVASGDTLIVLVWNHVASGSPPLHRPTVADAEDYPYYRPRPNANDPYGLTEPLPPNPAGLPPQPEVVMPETKSQGLQLPFRVVPA